MLIPVGIGEMMGKKQAREDAEHYAKGCDIDPKEGYYCTLITESGKKVALGFIVGATSEYVAIVENGRNRSIPIKDKEFSQYVAGDTKSAESNWRIRGIIATSYAAAAAHRLSSYSCLLQIRPRLPSASRCCGRRCAGSKSTR